MQVKAAELLRSMFLMSMCSTCHKSKFVIWMFQAKHAGESFKAGPDKMIHNQNVNIPPATHLIGDLEPHSLYAVRVACHSSQGPSDWSHWVELRTKEGGEASNRRHVCFHPGCVLVRGHLLWSELRSRLCYLATDWVQVSSHSCCVPQPVRDRYTAVSRHN